MASPAAFSTACIELYSRLWAELEPLSSPESCGSMSTLMLERAEILRLEIHLVLEACDSARWRLLLNVAQRHDLRIILQSVMLGLQQCAREPDTQALACAQNRLLDAVIQHCRHETLALPAAMAAGGVSSNLTSGCIRNASTTPTAMRSMLPTKGSCQLLNWSSK